MDAYLRSLSDGGKVVLPGVRGSISSGITLENENGNVVVSDVRKDNTILKNLGISKGDELVGATIYFDNLSKNDVMDILKATEPYKTGLKLHVKNEVKSPESTFSSPAFNVYTDDLGSRDSVYESLFNNKIKRHLKAAKSLENLYEPSNKRANRETASKFSDRIIARIESPRLDIQGSDIKTDLGVNIKSPEIDALVPNKKAGQFKAPDLNVDSRESTIKMPLKDIPRGTLSVHSEDLQIKGPELNGKIDIKDPKLKGIIKGNTIDMEAPDINSIGLEKKVKQPKFKMPSFGQSNIEIPSLDLSLPDITEDFKAPSAKVDLPNTDVKGPKLQKSNVTARIPDVDLNLKTPEIKGDCTIPYPKLNANIEGPDLDINAPNISLKQKMNAPHFKASSVGMSGHSVNAPELKGNIKEPSLDVSLPQVAGNFKSPATKVDLPNVNVKGPAFKIPSLGGKFNTKAGAPDVDLNVESPEFQREFDIPSPNLKTNIEVPNVDINPPNIKLKNPEQNFNMPHFKMPSFEMSGTSVKAPVLKGNIQAPSLDVSVPEVKGDFKSPSTKIDTSNVDVKGPTFKMPSMGGKFNGKAVVPDVDLNSKVPEIKGDFHIPSPTLKTNIEGPDLDLNAPNISVKGPKNTFNTPQFKMPSFGMSGPSVKATELDAKVKPPSLDGSFPKIEGDFKPPTAKVDLPNADVKGPKFKMPSLGGMFHTKGGAPDADLNVKAPEIKGDLDIAPPKLKTNIKAPDVDINTPNINMKGPEKTFNAPHFKMPAFKMTGPSVNPPDGNIKTPSLDVSLPGVEGDFKPPSAKVDLPNADVKGPKFKMPSVGGIFNTKTGAPDLDLNVKTPKMKGDIDMPSPNINANIEGPDVDINAPNISLKGPENKLNVPHFKMPSFGMSGPSLKTPEVEVDGKMKKTELDISVPKVKGKFQGPEVGVDLPDVDISAPKMKIPSIDVPSGKLSLPEAGLNLKAPELKGDLNIKDPKLKGDIKIPNLDIEAPSANLKKTLFKMPTLKKSAPNIKTPELDLSLPKVEGHVNSPSAKIDVPKVEAKGSRFKIPSLKIFHTKAGIPDVDLGLKSPDLKGDFTVPTPKLEGDLKSASLDYRTPDLGVKTSMKSMTVPSKVTGPDINLDLPTVEAKGRKFKMPSFGMSGPSIKAPELEGNIKAPSLDVSMPKVETDFKAPRAKVDLPHVESKSPKFKMPSFGGMFNTKTGVPDVDLNVEAPDVKGDFDIPSPKLKTNIEGPDLDINAPNISLKGSEKKMNLPDIKMPSFGMSGPSLKSPEIEVDGKLKKPEVDVLVPKVKGKFKGPEVGVDMPDVDITAPTIKIPSVDMSSGNISLPEGGLSVNAPELKGDLNIKDPKLKGDIKVPKPDVKAPNISMKAPDIRGSSPQFKIPSFGITGPKIKAPQLDGKIDSPTVDVSMPKIEGGFKAPLADVDLPNVDVKGPKIKMPSFGGLFSTKTEVPNADINVKSPGLKGNFDINAPKAQAKVDSPTVDLNAPNLNLKSSEKKINMPEFKMPSFGITGPSVKAPELDGNLKMPSLDVSLPKVEGDLKAPSAKVDSSSLDVKGPKFKMPSLGGMFNTKAGVPDANLNINSPELKGDFDINAPKAQAKIDGPGIDINAPNVNLKGSEKKINLPEFKKPSFGISGPSVKAPELDGNLKMPSLDASLPKVEGDLKAPSAKVDPPSLDVKGPKFKMPSLGGMFNTKAEIPEVDLNVKGPDMKGDFDIPYPKLKTNIEGPDLDINAPNVSLKDTTKMMNLPNIKMPSFNMSGPSLKKPEIEVDGKLKKPEVDVSVPKVKGKFQGPEIGVDLPDADMTAPKIKISTVDMPSGNLSLPKGGLSVNAPDLKSDLNIKDPKVTGNMKVPNVDVKVPNINVKGSDTKVSSPHFKMPSFGLSGPSFKGPELDGNIETPSLDVSLPKVDGKITKPDLSVQAPKVKGSEINMSLPKAELKPSKFKMPKFFQKKTIPSADVSLKSPEITSNVNAPKLQSKIEGPELALNAPDIHLKKSDKKTNSLGFKLPEFPFTGPSLNSPDLEAGGMVNERGIDVTMPKTKGTFKGPDVNVDLPSAKITDPKIKMPSLNISSDKHVAPEGDLLFKTPQLKGSSGTLDPKVEASLKGPKLDVNVPDIALKKPETKSTFSKFKGPAFKMSGPTVQAPDFDVSLPKVEAKLESSMANARLPCIDTEGPNVEMALPDISHGKGVPEMNLNVNAPRIKGNLEASTPKLQGSVEGPSVDMDEPSVSLKRSQKNNNLPQFNMPSVKMSGPSIETPKMKVGGRMMDSDMDISLPDVQNKINVDKPDISVPKVKLPSASISAVKPQQPDVSVPTDKISKKKKILVPDIDLNLEAPELKGEVDLSAPELDKHLHPKTSDTKLSGPQFKLPSFGLSGPSVQTPEVKLDVGSGTQHKNTPHTIGVDLDSPKESTNSSSPNKKGKGSPIKLPFSFSDSNFTLPEVDFGF